MRRFLKGLRVSSCSSITALALIMGQKSYFWILSFLSVMVIVTLGGAAGAQGGL